MSLRDELHTIAKEAEEQKQREREAIFKKRLEDSKEGLLKLEAILKDRAKNGCFSMVFDEDYLERLGITNDVFIHFSRENGFIMSGSQSFGNFKTFTLIWSDDKNEY